MRASTALGLLLGLAACGAMDEDMAELAAVLRDSCVQETGVRAALLAAVDAGGALTAAPDPELKCYVRCVMEAAGMLADGAVDVEAVLALLPDDMRRKNEASLRACGTRSGADDCETAFLTQACWQQANPDDYFLI